MRCRRRIDDLIFGRRRHWIDDLTVGQITTANVVGGVVLLASELAILYFETYPP